jgi:hypothetical protein
MNKGKSKLYSAIFKYKLTGKTRYIGNKGYFTKYGRRNLPVSIEQCISIILR